MAEPMRPARARRVGFEQDRALLAVHAETGVAFVRVALEAVQAAVAALQALRALAERSLSARLIKIHAESLGFVVAREALPAAGVVPQAAEGCAVVTVLAPSMRSIPGLMARMGEALYRCGVEVHRTADSHSSVSCVMPDGRAGDVAAALRMEFGLGDDAGERQAERALDGGSTGWGSAC